MKVRFGKWGMGLAMLSGLVMLGCAARAPRVPIFADPDLANMKFDTVTILPAVDRRVDKSSAIDLEKHLRDNAAKALRKKGYTVLAPETFSEQDSIPNDAVAEMEARELATLGPAGTQMMLVLYLDDASGKTGLGYSFKAETTAELLNKQTAAVLWKDKGVASQGQGGLMGCAMAGELKSGTLSSSVASMLESFPDALGKSR